MDASKANVASVFIKDRPGKLDIVLLDPSEPLFFHAASHADSEFEILHNLGIVHPPDRVVQVQSLIRRNQCGLPAP